MRAWPAVYVPVLPERFTFPALRLFDTSKGQIRVLTPKPVFRMYVCGITPYDATHLGHAATYLTFDLINRYLRASGSRVKYAQNITDIDDPLLERAARDGVDWQTLAHSQIDLFRADMTDLHIIPPDDYVGVVESMSMIAAAIEKLKAQSSTYLVDNDLYFRVNSDPHYGERSHLDHQTALSIFAERGGDPARPGKENPFDALLWLRSKPDQPTWPSPHGDGRPGWHIECSAIALNYLADDSSTPTSIDIQGGGSDLVFPHHEMSAAQCFVMSGKSFSDFYIHAGMIGLDGEKMSKSRGNLVFVSRLIQSGVNPMAIRWALLDRDYRSDFMWSSEHLKISEMTIERLSVNLSKVDVAPTDSVIEAIINLLANDLDTSAVLELLRQWCIDTENGASGGNAGELSRGIDTLLGLAL